MNLHIDIPDYIYTDEIYQIFQLIFQQVLLLIVEIESAFVFVNVTFTFGNVKIIWNWKNSKFAAANNFQFPYEINETFNPIDYFFYNDTNPTENVTNNLDKGYKLYFISFLSFLYLRYFSYLSIYSLNICFHNLLSISSIKL